MFSTLIRRGSRSVQPFRHWNATQVRMLSKDGGLFSNLKKIYEEELKKTDLDKTMEDAKQTTAAWKKRAQEAAQAAQPGISKVAESLKDSASTTAEAASKAAEGLSKTASKLSQNVEKVKSSSTYQATASLTDNLKKTSRQALDNEYTKSAKEKLDQAQVQSVEKLKQAVDTVNVGPVKGAVQFIKQEVHYLKEFADSFKRREGKKAKHRLAVGETIKSSKKKKTASAAAMEAEAEEEFDPDAPPATEDPLLAPVLVGPKITKWEERLGKIKAAFRTSKPVKSVTSIPRQLRKSENPTVQKVVEKVDDISDTVQDLGYVYEESQHPIIANIRNTEDKITSESPTGWAVGEIQELDPSFTINQFLEDMEEYMIPVVITAFFKPDMNVLNEVVEEGSLAARVVFATNRERQVQGVKWDERILDISHVDFQKGEVIDDEAHLVITFQIQHINCHRNAKGEIVTGSESDIQNTYWQWVLIRDMESDHFDWKIREMYYQKIYALV